MFSFVVENKGNANLSVTGTYMRVLKDACLLSGGEVEYIKKGEYAHKKDSYIVTDTIQAAFWYLCKGYKNHIIWMQGIVPEESLMRNNSKLRFNLIGIMEKLVLQKAKLVLLVSEEMRAHYEKKYHLDLSGKSIIMPCFNETDVVETAFRQEKYDKNSFVYVGTLHAWQCFEETVKLYAEIEKSSKTASAFYVYTFQLDRAREILSQYGVRNYVVDCVDKEALSERIRDIKYGFVLREDCSVNHVATPTKFSNYLANGIIPIYSNALKAFSSFDKELQIGIAYNLDEQEQGIKRILDHMNQKILAEEIHEKCENAFQTYYNADQYKKMIADKIAQIVQ